MSTLPFPRLFTAILTGAFFLLSYTSSFCQPFEYLYGAASVNEDAIAGTAAVTSCNGGGYIAVGSTFGTTSDVYAIRTNPNGTRLWEFSYDITIGQTSGNDIGRSIAELPNGGFVITGYTDVSGNEDVLVLMIDCNGNIVPGGVRTYGSTANDRGQDVAISAFASDIIVAGETYGGTTGTQDGLLLKTTLGGGLIFMTAYDNGNTQDVLRGVIETTVGTPGDIVAAGSSISPMNLSDGWMLRTNPLGGVPAVPPFGSTVVGGTQPDHLTSVIERKAIPGAPNSGNLVFIGSMSSFTATGLHDIYVVEASGTNICTVLGDQKIGDMAAPPYTAYDDYGIDLVEATAPLASYNVVTGDIVITGTTTYSHSAGQYEGFLIPLGLNLAPKAAGFGRLFGDHATNEDIFFSIDETTNGYVMGGWSKNHPFDNTDPKDLYIVRTNASGMTCCDVPWDPTWWQLLLTGNCVLLGTTNLTQSNTPPATATSMNTAINACTTQCSFPRINVGPGGSIAEKEFEQNKNVRLFPNPIARGGSVVFEYDDVLSSEATVTVSNTLGEIIYTDKLTAVKESITVSLNTERWPSGSYLVEIVAGEQRDAVRLIVE